MTSPPASSFRSLLAGLLLAHRPPRSPALVRLHHLRRYLEVGHHRLAVATHLGEAPAHERFPVPIIDAQVEAALSSEDRAEHLFHVDADSAKHALCLDIAGFAELVDHEFLELAELVHPGSLASECQGLRRPLGGISEAVRASRRTS